MSERGDSPIVDREADQARRHLRSGLWWLVVWVAVIVLGVRHFGADNLEEVMLGLGEGNMAAITFVIASVVTLALSISGFTRWLQY